MSREQMLVTRDSKLIAVLSVQECDARDDATMN